MTSGRTIALLFLSISPAVAPAATTTFGSSRARLCYEAAELQRSGNGALAECDHALGEDALTRAEQVATLVNRGILRMRRDDQAGALADFDAASAIDPREPEAYLNKGVALLRSEQGWEPAGALFEEALRLGTHRPEFAYFGQGVVKELSGDAKGAYYAYKRASEAAPDWDRPREELARFTVSKKS